MTEKDICVLEYSLNVTSFFNEVRKQVQGAKEMAQPMKALAV